MKEQKLGKGQCVHKPDLKHVFRDVRGWEPGARVLTNFPVHQSQLLPLPNNPLLTVLFRSQQLQGAELDASALLPCNSLLVC